MAPSSRLVRGCAGISTGHPYLPGTDVGKAVPAGWRTCRVFYVTDADAHREREIPIPAGTDAQVPAGTCLFSLDFCVESMYFRRNINKTKYLAGIFVAKDRTRTRGLKYPADGNTCG